MRDIDQFLVSADQMRQIEGRIFAAGMPVSALMEKVGGLLTQRITAIWSALNATDPGYIHIGILAGPGHNGGDAFVIARELKFRGYNVRVYTPFSKYKELTNAHKNYAASIGISLVDNLDLLLNCDFLIDGLFGFGLESPIPEKLVKDIELINSWHKFIFSIDIPSGIHTDTGRVLGGAIRANYTLCLGLWKRAFCQDQALEYIGESALIDFDIPLEDIRAILDSDFPVKRLTKANSLKHLPLVLPPTTYKYKNGHLLLIAGSHRYTGAAILAGLGARSSGVGMLSIAVPESIKPQVISQIPEAIVISCPETKSGAIHQFSPAIDLNNYDAIACGPGLTLDAALVIESVLESKINLVLDADGLNCLAQLGTIPILSERQAKTVITPHFGEFKRLFPNLVEDVNLDRINGAIKAAQVSNSIVVLKGAKTVIATPDLVSINPDSTPALARGGSGDVLTGLIGGLIATASARNLPIDPLVSSGVWWHSQAAILAAKERTQLGVDPFTLTQYLNRLPM